MSYDATAKTLRCPFCGSERIEAREDSQVLLPRRVVPFRIDRVTAEQTLRRWLKKGFWRPSDLAHRAVVSRFTNVYVPYWVFAAETHTFWTGDTGQVPFGARSSWYPVTGENRGIYGGLLVGASSTLTPNETNALRPFDISSGVPPQQVDLNSITVEQFSVPRKYARPLARQGFEQQEYAACVDRYFDGGHRNLHVNVRITQLHSEPVLLPVWIMAYRYRGQVYRFLLNGQTGATTGEAPVSKLKVIAASVVAILVILVLLLLFALSNS